jgi:hypothetical protein
MFPQVVLMRARNAPFSSGDDPAYFLNRKLQPTQRPDQRLPDSDLLKAIHVYAADFYARALPGGEGAVDVKSMDETALLAFGILLEEAAESMLGETGDLALVEGREVAVDEAANAIKAEGETEKLDAVGPLPSTNADYSVKMPASSQSYYSGERERKRRKLGSGSAPSHDDR